MVWLGKPDTHSTWELASSLPQSLIEEYEKDIQSEVAIHTDIQYGHRKPIFSVTTTSHHNEPASKKPKHDRPVANQSTG